MSGVRSLAARLRRASRIEWRWALVAAASVAWVALFMPGQDRFAFAVGVTVVAVLQLVVDVVDQD